MHLVILLVSLIGGCPHVSNAQIEESPRRFYLAWVFRAIVLFLIGMAWEYYSFDTLGLFLLFTSIIWPMYGWCRVQKRAARNNKVGQGSSEEQNALEDEAD